MMLENESLATTVQSSAFHLFVFFFFFFCFESAECRYNVNVGGESVLADNI